MKGQRSVDIIEEDLSKSLIKIAKPVGVVGAIIPVTNCEATPVLKSMNAIKTRNAVILAPHPRSVKTNKIVVDLIRELLEQNGFPADLVIHMDEVSMENTQGLMQQCDLILATGGGGLVKAAYSGKPLMRLFSLLMTLQITLVLVTRVVSILRIKIVFYS